MTNLLRCFMFAVATLVFMFICIATVIVCLFIIPFIFSGSLVTIVITLVILMIAFLTMIYYYYSVDSEE